MLPYSRVAIMIALAVSEKHEKEISNTMTDSMFFRQDLSRLQIVQWTELIRMLSCIVIKHQVVAVFVSSRFLSHFHTSLPSSRHCSCHTTHNKTPKTAIKLPLLIASTSPQSSQYASHGQ